MINDISALRMDPQMAATAAECNVPLILMHMQGSPKNMQVNPVYEDLIEDVKTFLDQAMQTAVAAGVDPAGINLDLYNKYGHVYIDEVAGHARIELKYGKLTANKLTRGNDKPLNTVNLAYASGSSINECNWLKANVKYSGLEIESARAVIAYTSYMKLAINEVSSVVIEGKYDNYSFGKLSNLVVNTSYSSIKAEELSKKLEADTKYTNVKIDYMPAGFEGIKINSKYGTYKIGLDEDASYKLDGEADYSKIYYHDTGKVSRIQENTSMKVYGNVGSDPDPAAEVIVYTKYGNVKLYE
jgi:hypothetical protein